jgi:uncharacterized protein YgbK (DUF1537 family)
MYLGVIADDFTGGSDIALTLARGGLHVVQHIGVPGEHAPLPEADAIVVSLKSRTAPMDDAVGQSLSTLRELQKAGAQQFFFKYCSTFDSTDRGNIGPVADALRDALSATVVPFCPAFPSNARTVYRGHLFVGDLLLSDSPMKDHPLTPMRDASLVRVLQRQTATGVGLIPFAVVDEGDAAIRAAYQRAIGAGTPFVVVDALTDRHLHAIGRASAELPLLTGGSGVAIGLPDNLRRAGAARGRAPGEGWQAPAGARAILAGSCSAATRGQVQQALEAGLPSRRLDPRELADPEAAARELARWARPLLGGQPILVYSSADPADVRKAQDELGTEVAGERVEHCLAALVRHLVEDGVRQLIVAGGETSGAVVGALGAVDLDIGPEIDPGVPWMSTTHPVPIAMALKSGNFGTSDFFMKAWNRL